MKTLVFYVPQLSQPRPIKRINAIYKAGIPIKVYGIDNGLYSENLKTAEFPIEHIYDRGRGKLDRFLKRYTIIWDVLKRNKGSLFYFFDYTPALRAFFLGCRNYIYEESDVAAVKFKSRLKIRISLNHDRCLIKKSQFTVFTSEGFVRYLFPKKQPENYLLMPNKLSPFFQNVERPVKNIEGFDVGHIKFGFIGLIRYPNTIVRFARVVGKHFPNHEFHFFGDVERPSYLDEEIKNFSNVYFHGPFVNPIDLQEIYRQVDINIACYDTTSINVQIAEPNKLYESIFFKTPLLVSDGTFLAEKVNELGIGESLNASDDNSLISFIGKINNDWYAQIINVMEMIDSSDLIDSPIQLIEKIKTVL